MTWVAMKGPSRRGELISTFLGSPEHHVADVEGAFPDDPIVVPSDLVLMVGMVQLYGDAAFFKHDDFYLSGLVSFIFFEVFHALARKRRLVGRTTSDQYTRKGGTMSVCFSGCVDSR